MFVKESKNFTFWQRVFDEILNNPVHDGLVLNGEMILVHDGANMDSYPEVSILGVFRLPDAQFVAISFTLDASRDEISNIKTEIQKGINDFKTMTPEEGRFVEAKL